MANHGPGTKFASVNLNKSYGQSPNHHHQQHYIAAQSGFYSSNRAARPGTGGGAGGGMVVLSRPRSSQKAGSKLSVPPPLNLPSLRKEHERFDPTGSGGGHANGGLSGSGSRPSSSGVGWTKPAAVALQEKEGSSADHLSDSIDRNGDGVGKGSNGVYMPPSTRSVGMGPLASSPSLLFPRLDKATVLKGEDFPSLQAALPVVSGTEKKHKDGLNHKYRQMGVEVSSYVQTTGSRSSSLVTIRPQLQSGNDHGHGLLSENYREDDGPPGKARKQDDCFPGPLPLVRLNPRSDWADDERDVSHSFSDQGRMTDRGRDHQHSKINAYWDSDFDMPRTSMLLHRPAHSLVNKWRQHDNEIGKAYSSEVNKTDSYGLDMRTPSKEGQHASSWRVSSPLPRDGFATREAVVDRNGNVARPSMIKEKDNKYIPSTLRGSAQDDVRRELGQAQMGQRPWNNPTDSFISRGSDMNRREQFSSDQSNKYKSDIFRNSSASKLNSSIGSKGLPVINSIVSFGREKRPFGKNDKLYAEDPFVKDFTVTGLEGQDTFPGSLVGVVKRKKDILKETNFHDPVRESFEAELERVQQMQEQERQRVIEEQERALEMARREEEERIRLVKEQEEKQRRIEEEAREAAWRAEQERREATRRADELRIAREEEKSRMLMEEERRKQAAKQKLLELEEKIAKRQAESVRSGGSTSDEKASALVKERDLAKTADVGDWEDGERMVERITTSASSDSSSLNRPFESNSRSHFSREGSTYSGRGKSFNSWRRDGSEGGNGLNFVGQDAANGLLSLRRDESVGGRTYSKKEPYGDAGFPSVRSCYRAGVPEPMMDDFGHHRNERWNIFGDGDHYGRNAEIGSEFRENLAENFGDAGWGHHSRNSAYSLYPERFYQNPEGDGVYSYGASRYSTRQPRVPPPPSLFGIQKASHRGQNEEPGSTSFPDNEVLYSSERSGSTMDRGYNPGQKDSVRHPSIVDMQPEKSGSGVTKLDNSTARCDSQSSVSVSSPPDSPIHLSHDDLDESEDSAGFSVDQDKEVRLSGQGSEPRHLTAEAAKEKFGAVTSSVSESDDEEWNDNNNKLQEQEEYDEDEEGYQDDDELREGENVNTDLTQEFEVMHLGEKESEHMMDNLVLGFNEGVEVAMPNDEFEKNSANEDTSYAMSQMTTGILEEKGSVDGVRDREVHQFVVDAYAQGTSDGSNIFKEAEGMRDLAIQACNTSQTSLPSELQEHLDASGNACLPAQKGFPSPINMDSHSSSAESVMSAASSIQNSAEVPIKLQFGLFSGPSLIPSPVPAIQIGSIQMPLHLHSQAGTSLTHMHPSQPPLFQFGQLRYASPVSQGLLPLGPQSMPFGQPSILNHSSIITQTVQSAQETNSNVKEETLAASLSGKAPLTKQDAAEVKNTDDSRFKLQTGFTSEDHEHISAQRNSKTVSVQGSVGQLHTVPESSHLTFSKKDLTLPKSQGHVYGGRGKRHAFTVKNSNPRTFPASEVPRHDSTRFQKRNRRLRTEFRIRENAEKNQTEMACSHLDDRTEANSRSSGNFSKNGLRKVNTSKMNEAQCSGSTPVTSQEIDHVSRAEKGSGKETLPKSKRTPPSGENSHKRNIDKDMDGTLQSGVVRVFEQPGIEAPSDEDDFIEVRSKRQMLNNRREQREKEIKAKSRNSKLPRKPALASQNATPSTCSNKIAAPADGEAINSFGTSYVGSGRPNLGWAEVSAGFNATIGSKSLADRKTQTMKSIENTCTPASSANEPILEPGIVFECMNKVLDNVKMPVSSWGNSGINQQFDSSSSIRDQPTSVGESMSSLSVLTKEKQFTTSNSSIKYLLAGENIQFGAVTSPAVLPKSSRVHGVGPPGPCWKEVQILPYLSSVENGCTLLFEKEKQSCESSSRLEDSEAEAEAAASAVAVAAITSDEVVGNGIGSCPVSVSETKSFGGTGNGGISTGVAADQQLSGQSKVEDSLSVSLPADLSVESPPISLWPPMPSPQNSSGQIISHFPGGPPHFPFFEMNPMLRSPMFAFGPHEESTSAQPQTQKSTAPSSSPVATWQQCHSGVDSFYGPPAGFSGPFIGSPGGIPGVQGHRHMVVYNHFAPVGQFGQLGLSFMGTTYIPSGKQPDWKHSPATSTMSVSEGEKNSMNMTSSQHNPSNLPTPMQHLAPGSPLMPVASPLAMFDVSPFQSAPDVSVQPHWLHVPPSSLPPAPLSMSSNQQAEAVLSSQYNNHAIDNTSASSKFPESHSSAPSDSSRKFSMTSNATVAQLPDELGLAETSNSTIIRSSLQNVGKSSQFGAYTAKVDIHNHYGKNNGQGSSSALNTLSLQPKNSQHFGNSSGNNHPKGAKTCSKNSSGDWSHRRMGFQARNPPFGSDKIFSASKMKQIYVAKQATNGSSNSS